MHYQHQLLESSTPVIDLPDADIRYWPDFLNNADAGRLFDLFVREVDWRQERITLYGKTHDVPRLSCWMADDGLDYGYSNMTMHPVAWSAEVSRLKQKLEKKTMYRFNSVLLNYYRDGQDSNGWHADDEPELGINPVIASLSLGAARDFKLRHKVNKQLKYSIALDNGSLLLMQGQTQACWQHHIPKRANAKGRINLTFRTI